jgi:regulatory protein
VAARFLARGPRTEAEVRAKLEGMGWSPEATERTLARCRELGWVNDAVLAEDRARALRKRGAGSLKLAAELEGRGVAAALVEAAIEASRDGQSEASWARRALEDAGVAVAPTPKAWRLLAGRGFAEEVVMEVLGEME